MGRQAAWQAHTAGRLILHVRPFSPAARDVDELAARYSEALAGVSDALDVDADALPTISVYLADLPTDDPDVSTDPRGSTVSDDPETVADLTIWTAYGDEAPAVGAEEVLARALVTHGFGTGQAESRFWHEGLAGHVAAQSGRSAFHEEAVTHCRDLLNAGGLPPVAELVAESGHRVSAVVATASCAFASYLIDRFGLPRYRDLLQAVRSGDEDAFETAYPVPLAVADRDWRRHLEASGAKGEPGLLATLRHLLPIARPHWRTGLAVAACSLVGIAFSLAMPLSFRFLIDNVLARRPLSHAIPLVGSAGYTIEQGQGQIDVLFLLLGFLGLLYVANAAARLVMNLILAVVGETFSFELRQRLVKILDGLPATYYARRTPSDISQRVIHDVETVQQVVTRATVPMLSGAFAILCFAGILFLLEPKLALVTFVGLPIVAAIHGARRRGRRAAARERVRRTSDLAGGVNEAASAQTLAKLYQAGSFLAGRLLRRMEVHRELNSAFARENAFLAQSGALVLGLIQVAVLLVGGYMVIVSEGRDLAPGSLVAFYLILNQLLGPIGQVSAASQTISGASASVERTAALLTEPTEQDRDDAQDIGPLRREIRFDGVSFAYPDGKLVLKGVSLAIPAGATVAFVGPTGAGKSSILHLLPRLYEPTRGTISWDGIDVRKIRLASLRSQIGLVFQESVLLNASVYDNIRFGLDGVSDAEVRQAAHLAAADELIEQLPQGYDTVVGQSGSGLSGGQRQRVALARAILRDPSVLILDEATSALDATTQRLVQERLLASGASRCIVKVAHRLETVVDADIIFVLDDGHLVEQGSHADLLVQGGLYARLFADQTAPLNAASESAVTLAVHRLRQRAPFSHLDASTLEAIGSRLRPVSAQAGSDLYRQGDDSDALYVLMRGRVELHFPRGDGRTTISEVEAGGLLGDSSFLAGRARPATALVTSDATLFQLSRQEWTAIEANIGQAPGQWEEPDNSEHGSSLPEAAGMVRSRPPTQTLRARTASDRSTSRLPRSRDSRN